MGRGEWGGGGGVNEALFLVGGEDGVFFLVSGVGLENILCG